MPELPEVEATCRSLRLSLEGARVLSATPGKPLRWPLGCAPDALEGERVVSLSRRSKYLIMKFGSGHCLLWHLGMSGSLAMHPRVPPPGPHDHFDLVTDRGVLRLNDPRRFGAVVFVRGLDDPVATRLLGSLGPEPMGPDFAPESFYRGLRARRTQVKLILLGGELVVGVGNIYASEALFLAGIRPTVAGRRVSRARAQRLHAAIRDVLGRAIELGGTTIRNFSDAQGHNGAYQDFAMVYGRDGQACKQCGTAIRRIVQGQRSSFFCPTCQRP